MESQIHPCARQPYHVMVKPIGPLCNLDCSYCFYLEKEALHPTNERWRMSDGVLENFIRSYIESQPANEVTFAWQGGEPTLCGVDFFRRAMEMQHCHAGGKRITNALQTNGTLLNDEWGAFLAEYQFLVGISIDGPEKIHDAYRVTKRGGGSFKQVMAGLDILKKHGVEFNTLTCVHRMNQSKGADVYRFLKGIGSKFMQFIPIVERKPDSTAQSLGLSLASPPDLAAGDVASPVTPWSVTPEGYGRFMIDIFDRWVRQDVGRFHVQLFDVALGKWLGIPGGLCVFEETCGNALALEHDGSLYSCDHFVYPEFRLGDLAETPLASLVDSPRQQRFGTDKRDRLPKQCRGCDYRFACNGGCPKQRFSRSRDGEPGLNYLCEGYYSIFKHMDPYMRVMADLYRRKRPPADIMGLLRDKRIPGLS
jgi:uncharacterized protein